MKSLPACFRNLKTGIWLKINYNESPFSCKFGWPMRWLHYLLVRMISHTLFTWSHHFVSHFSVISVIMDYIIDGDEVTVVRLIHTAYNFAASSLWVLSLRIFYYSLMLDVNLCRRWLLSLNRILSYTVLLKMLNYDVFRLWSPAPGIPSRPTAEWLNDDS